MKLISSLVGFILLTLALCFAFSNRQSTTINLWPFGLELSAPLYLISLGTLFLGLFLGALVAWLCMLPHHFTARRLRKDITRLHGKIEDLQQTVIEPVRKSSLVFSKSAARRRFWGLKR